jgi:hypothetical protein
MLNRTGWEWWDNRKVTADVRRTQSWDGFHFDRTTAQWSSTQHQHTGNRTWHRARKRRACWKYRWRSRCCIGCFETSCRQC